MPHEYKKSDQDKINGMKLDEILREFDKIEKMIDPRESRYVIPNFDGRKLAMAFTHIELTRMYLEAAKLDSSVEGD